MSSLAIALVAALAPIGERLLPSLDYATKSPAEWMHEFEAAETKTAEPLWCLYWNDARTPEVIEFFLQQRAQLPDPRSYPGAARRPNIVREIEAICTQWDVERQPLPPQWDAPRAGAVVDGTDPDVEILLELLGLKDESKPPDARQRWYRVPSGLFPLPTPTLDESDAAIVARLGSKDRLEQTEAAVTLIAHRREIAPALRALVLRVAEDRDHGLRGENDAKVMMGDDGDSMKVYSGCTWHMREPCVLQVFALEHVSAYAFEWATGVLGTAGARALASMIRAGGSDARAVERACAFGGAPATHWTTAAQEIIADAQQGRGGSSSTAHRANSSETSSGSSAGTRTSEGAGAAPYGHFVSPWKDVAPTSDPRTRRVIELGESMSARLEHGDAIDEDLRRLLAVLRAPYGMQGADGPNDSYQAGLWILKALHVTTPDVADWCIGILLDKDHFDIHVEDSMEILRHCRLSFAQRALVVQASDQWMDYPRSSFFAGLGPVSIERSARLRSYAQERTDVSVLRDLLKIARASAQDLEMVAAALDRGYASDRALALAILDEHPEFASPELRSSVARAKDDCDDDVRDAARALISKRGW